MHRNTYIVVSILAVTAALVVGVNLGKRLTTTAPAASPTPTETQGSASPAPTPVLKSYTDTTCGFSINYPDTFTLSQDATGSAVLQDTADDKNSIVMTCQKDIPRPALTDEKIEALTLTTTTGSTVSATIYHSQSAKDGAPIDALLFTHPVNKLDVFIAGYGETFNTLINTVQVIP